MDERSLWDFEVVAQYMNRIGADPSKLTECIVNRRSSHGYPIKKCEIRFRLDGEIICDNEDYAPTKEEAAEISDLITNKGIGQYLSLIALLPLNELTKYPPGLSERDTIYTFRDQDSRIIMLRHKIVKDDRKFYVPWTYWTDGVWRKCEPDGRFPLFNLDHIGNREIVYVHEGEKAAAHMAYLMNHVDGLWRDHPWGQEMRNTTHIGWCTGANTPERTDWAPLNRAKIKEVYIVADNDIPGKKAVPKLAKLIKHPTYQIQFSDLFPDKFDLADNFPENFYERRNGVKYYIGPSYHESLEVATWATDLIKKKDVKGREKLLPRLRSSFSDQWSYIQDVNLFVCNKFPWIRREKEILNNTLMQFSHTKDTSSLILKEQVSRTRKIAYRPDIHSLIITDGASSSINTHFPPQIEPIEGDYAPFIEFMEYLIPNEKERYQVLKWCATLISKPSVKIMYALLLISKVQGTGKLLSDKKSCALLLDILILPFLVIKI